MYVQLGTYNIPLAPNRYPHHPLLYVPKTMAVYKIAIRQVASPPSLHYVPKTTVVSKPMERQQIDDQGSLPSNQYPIQPSSQMKLSLQLQPSPQPTTAINSNIISYTTPMPPQCNLHAHAALLQPASISPNRLLV